MAMEYKLTIRDAHSKPITCISYHPFKKEIFTASEDNTIKVWESDSGKLLFTLAEHRGWVTNLFFCKELKVLFSCAIDGCIILWGQNYKVIQKIETKSPVYSLNFNARRNQLLAGYHSKVLVFPVLKDEERPNNALATATGTTASNANSVNSGLPGNNIEVVTKKPVTSSEHTDVVKCLVACESRFYSAGYDGKLVIYDSPHHGDSKLRVINAINNAHDAAVSCMVYGKDADNSWIITGGFDRVVKLWSLDGKCLQRFDGINDTVSSICYVLPTQTLWVNANTTNPIVYDPRGGINISEFVNTDHPSFHEGRTSVRFRQLTYIQEHNEVVAATSTRNVVVWKFNPYAPMTTLQVGDDVAEAVTFTTKEPLLIFSGGGDGLVRKWERLQLNAFMYSQEVLPMPRDESANLNSSQLTGNNSAGLASLSSSKTTTIKDYIDFQRKKSAQRKRMSERFSILKSKKSVKTTTTDASSELSKATKANKKSGDEGDSDEPDSEKAGTLNGITKAMKPSILKLIHYEPLDLLLCGFEDCKIGVWGYNEEAFKNVLNNGSSNQSNNAAPSMNDANSPDGPKDGVSNRVAGLSCRFIFQEHRDAVLALCPIVYTSKLFANNNCTCHYLLSSGMDQRLFLYDLSRGNLKDTLRDPSTGKEEPAADGPVYDIDYSPELDRFAYASGDGQGYIRKFSESGHDMTLIAVLQGHESDVTQIKWAKKYQQWITGSEDRTLRVWPSDGLPCLRVIYNDSPVSCLCIDSINSCFITGAMDKVIRVFDPEKNDEIVQKSTGHTDAVRSIVHIASRNQYVSASWDQTLRVWHAHFKKGQRRLAAAAAKLHLKANVDGSAGEDKRNSLFANEENVEEAPEPSFSDLNPLVVPKLLTKTLFVKEMGLGNIAGSAGANGAFSSGSGGGGNLQEEEEMTEEARHVTAVENELRSVLNDLEQQLNVSEKSHMHKKRMGKYNKAYNH